MIALRYVHVLALAVWLGGMVVLGAIVAPTTFQVLERAMAGALFGAVLARFHYLAYATGGTMLLTLVAMRLLGPRPHAFAFRAVLILAMLGVALYSGIVVSSTIDTIQAQAGGLPSVLPAGHALRVRFDELHSLSTRLMMANLVGALILLYWQARD
jgi:uncharacterized membrane protein